MFPYLAGKPVFLIRLFRIGGKVVSLFNNGKDIFLLQWRYLSQRVSL